MTELELQVIADELVIRAGEVLVVEPAYHGDLVGTDGRVQRVSNRYVKASTVFGNDVMRPTNAAARPRSSVSGPIETSSDECCAVAHRTVRPSWSG